MWEGASDPPPVWQRGGGGETHSPGSRADRHHAWVLQARELSVAVGGRLTLGEACFTLLAGQKVGLLRGAAGGGVGRARGERPPPGLSGGQGRRVEVARILVAGSDVLLLGEPTNHLDNGGKAWLMGFLRGYRGAVVVVSHDLELLGEAI